jgi:hypothetical protein
MISASDYVRQNYQPSDYLAALVLNRERGEKRQPIRTAEVIAGEEFQAWLRYKNAKGSDVYISQTPYASTPWDEQRPISWRSVTSTSILTAMVTVRLLKSGPADLCLILISSSTRRQASTR